MADYYGYCRDDWMSLLLNPFGTIDAILSLLGLDFYRDAIEDIPDDGPDRGKTYKDSTTQEWKRTKNRR